MESAIETFGADNQVLKAMEEMGELIQAIVKARITRNDARRAAAIDHVCEEIADVRLTLDQLCMILGTEERVGQWEYAKMARLREKIDATRPWEGR